MTPRITFKQRAESAVVNSIFSRHSAFSQRVLVGRTAETLFDKKGHRLIVKLKTKDFANESERSSFHTNEDL